MDDSISLPPWYATVPEDPLANRLWRCNVLREAAGSQRARDYLKAACEDDILFYFRAFYFTYDPRLPDGDKLLPFIPYPFQETAILTVDEAIEKGRDLVVYKSRDLGLSWICLGVLEKRWHFHRDQTFLCVARDKDEIDSPNYPDALFQKIDRVHANTPEWLMPAGWNPRLHRLRYAFGNPETGSTINGEATVAAAGVGGRRTAVLFDEFSRIEQAAELDFGTADTTNCRIFNFTAYGTGHYSYEFVRADCLKKKLKLGWWMDPRKNKKLYQWDGQHQRFKYFEWDAEKWDLVRVRPHEYGPDDADRVNYRADNGHPAGRPFEPVRDGVLRSPVYDQEDTRRGNRRYMAVNWDIDFEGADQRFYDPAMLQAYEREVCVPPVWEGEVEVDLPVGQVLGLRERPGGPLRLWFDPADGWPKGEKGFAAGADASRGKGASNSCAAFADVAGGAKVCEYVTPNEAPEVFAAKVVALCRMLAGGGGGPAFLAWERIGPGEDFGKTVVDLAFYDVYYDNVLPGQEPPPAKVPGWTPNRHSKRALHGEYDVALRNRRYLNRSSLAVRECERYEDGPDGVEYQITGGRGARAAAGGGVLDASGARESHGDRVVADALCNRAVRFQGGGQAGELAKARPAEKPPHPGTLAGRMAIHKALGREQGSYWG